MGSSGRPQEEATSRVALGHQGGPGWLLPVPGGSPVLRAGGLSWGQKREGDSTVTNWTGPHLVIGGDPGQLRVMGRAPRARQGLRSPAGSSRRVRTDVAKQADACSLRSVQRPGRQPHGPPWCVHLRVRPRGPWQGGHCFHLAWG